MTNVAKWGVLWFTGIFTSVLCGYLYGALSYGLDLFFVFPFIVAALITGATCRIAVYYRVPPGRALLVSGACFGALAYAAHVLGGFHAFSTDIQRQLQQTDPSITAEGADVIRDRILASETSLSGLLGYAVYNLKGSISFFTSSQSRQSGNYIIGTLIECFKLGVLTVVCSVALRDLTRVEQQNPSSRFQRPAPDPKARRRFRIVLAATVILVLVPLGLLLFGLVTF